jgi:hypothetical protein
MKLESYIKGEKRYATEAMSLLDTYLTKNPRISDIRLLMSDDQACDKFRRWSIVKKNIKDMGSLEKRHSSIPRSSFRRSKGSFFSGHSDDDTVQETFKKLQAV